MDTTALDLIIPIDRLKVLLDTLSKATGINLCVLDDMGRTLVPPCNDTLFCRCARSTETLKEKCLDVASHAAYQSGRKRRCIYYKCFFGLTCFAVPLFYKGKFMGATLGGCASTDIADEEVDISLQRRSLDGYPQLKELFSSIPFTEGGKIRETASLCNQLSAFIGNFHTLAELHPGDAKRSKGLNRLQDAIKYIQTNYNKKITVQTLAFMSFVTPDYFSRLFSSVTGKTVPQYVAEIRVKKAKELLADPSIKIRAVANAVGYDDPAYFMRKFKQITGVTPTEYQLSKISSK